MDSQKQCDTSAASQTSASGVVLRHLLEAYLRHVNDFVSIDYDNGRSVDGGDGLLDFVASEFKESVAPDDGSPEAVGLAHKELLGVIDTALEDLMNLRAGCLKASPDMAKLARSRASAMAVSNAMGCDPVSAPAPAKSRGPSPM